MHLWRGRHCEALMESTNYNTERSITQAQLSQTGLTDNSLKSIPIAKHENVKQQKQKQKQILHRTGLYIKILLLTCGGQQYAFVASEEEEVEVEEGEAQAISYRHLMPKIPAFPKF